ncbi:MAG: hypothetical protein P9X24_05505 [Candidatus Hatepunaea meridiana]|nr:hypothetical protein [Candidatus Hatepunaea meridiana]
MNKKDLFEKNLLLSTEFSRYLLENPDIAEQIPNDAIVVILPEYDKELAEENLSIAKARKEEGQSMVLVNVEKLAPPRKSRLIRPKMELVHA